MNEQDDEVAQLLDEAVARLSTCRRTFTDEEALLPIWERDYDISPLWITLGRDIIVVVPDGKQCLLVSECLATCC